MVENSKDITLHLTLVEANFLSHLLGRIANDNILTSAYDILLNFRLVNAAWLNGTITVYIESQ